jgi:hypothetical protein
MRPVEAGMLRWENMNDSNYSLCDFADANDYLDAKIENQYRASKPSVTSPSRRK